jgi:predicted RNA binding protein YcfA (HicA-like mRNA interferase family)
VTSRLPAVTPRQAIRALERCGWEFDRAKGSHRLFRHPDRPHRIVVPLHARDLAKGTLHQIIEASGVSREEFLTLL